MEQAILSDLQRKAIAAVGKETKLADYYLSGGTALAEYYLKHRFSDDLDFFVYNNPDAIFLHAFAEKLKTNLAANSVRFERLHDRNIFFFQIKNEELKVEFSKYPFVQLEKPVNKDGIKIDSLRDIAANKLMALLDRFDPKDFVDLFFILKTSKLADIRADVENKFGIKIDDIFLGGELAKVKRIEALPKMVKAVSIPDLKTFFTERARELTPRIFE